MSLHTKLFSARIILLVLISLAGALPAIRALDIRSLDLLHRDHVPHPDIAIIAIDTKSLQQLGFWPWDRSFHANLLNRLRSAEPRAVGFDISFFEPSGEYSDDALARSLAQLNAPVILAAEPVTYASGDVRMQWPLLRLTEGSNVSTGHVAVGDIIDGRARSMPQPIITDSEDTIPFAFALAEKVGSKVPDGDHRMINFAGPAGTFPTYSYVDVLHGDVSIDLLREKIILIGATAANLHDVVLVPLSGDAMAGVEWQANVLDNILLQRSIQLTFTWMMVGISLLLALILMLISHRLSLKAAGILSIGVLVIAIGLSTILYDRFIGLPFFWLTILIAITFIGDSVERWLEAEREKRMLRRSLEGYLSPPVLKHLMEHPEMLKLGGMRSEITSLFSDVRGFTTITETVDPTILANLLYEYFTVMTEEVFVTDGVVSGFMGDGLFAFWGAPIPQEDHAVRAVRAGINMMRKLEAIRPEWEKRGWPYVDIGIGINTGMATIGNLGSEKRFDYTAIGDCVNAAARLESLNKEHKTHILVSQIVVDRLPPDIKTRFVTDVIVKGKTVPLKMYEVTEENWQ